jgi:hypothetical protein
MDDEDNYSDSEERWNQAGTKLEPSTLVPYYIRKIRYLYKKNSSGTVEPEISPKG